MAREKKNNHKKISNGANVGYEAELWQMADALRGSMDAAEYKHVVLGLIFLKYISDAFEEQREKLEAERAQGADPEDPDEYRALSIFWVPPQARWSYLKSQAKQPKIGELVDDAMSGIERDNPSLKGVLPKDYARPGLDKQRLGQLIDMVSNVRVGDTESRSKDMLGRIYEYFLSQFASAEGKKGGEFYTPRSVVKLLVEMLEPYSGRNPGMAFDLAKTLIESACRTILMERGIAFDPSEDLPRLFRTVTNCLPFLPANASGEIEVRRGLGQTLNGLHTAVRGICELRNACGFASHGSGGPRPVMESIQALLAAQTADAIVGFLHRVHRQERMPSHTTPLDYEQNLDFNDYVDDTYKAVRIFSSEFKASEILYRLEPETYRLALAEYKPEPGDENEPAVKTEASEESS